MKQISQQEKEWLISKKILKMEGGKYPDLSTVCGKKKSRRKKCFVPDFMINIINKEMYDKNKEKN